MKKLLLLLGISYALLLPTAIFAQSGPDIGIGPGGLTQTIANNSGYQTAGVTDTTLSESIGRIIKIALSLVGTGFMALTIYAGILWMTASGNEEQVTSATNIIKQATVGLFIVIAGYGLTVFILIAITSSSGVPSNQIGGGAGIGAGGFWASFGQQFQSHWSTYVFP